MNSLAKKLRSLSVNQNDCLHCHQITAVTFVKFFLPAAAALRALPTLVCLILRIPLGRYHYPHFAEEEMEAQRGEVTCTRENGIQTQAAGC